MTSVTGSETPVASGAGDEVVPPAPEAAAAKQPRWWRHRNGRWVIGDAGRQPEVVAVPSSVIAADRPDTVLAGGRLGALEYRGVSVRGFSHQEKGSPRQDAYQIRPSRDGAWLVGCVADGVAEGNLSHQAADLVCREATTHLGRVLADHPPTPEPDWQKEVDALPWQHLVDAANTAIVAEALTIARAAYTRKPEYAEQLARLAEQEYTMSDARKSMSSTGVAFAVHSKVGDDGTYAALVAVLAGDSNAMLLREAAWHPLTPVKNEGAEVMSSGVESLPRPVTVEPIALQLQPGDLMVVMTDGLGDALASGAGIVGDFLATMWRQPPDQLAFAQHLGFYRRTFTDDRTAVAIWVEPS
ncbi:MAG: hypothetical protein QOE61_1363 [Micromonosporaceae bacterium]|nr:hypothetical protein [Micromonosporaceae bacterium]